MCVLVCAGEQVAAFAKHGGMTVESAREHMNSSRYLCSKARMVAAHIRHVHPDRPAVVVYSSLGFKRHFAAAAAMQGQPADRQLYIYGSQDDGQQLADFKRDAKPFARSSAEAPAAGAAPPILLASHEVVGTGIDGLQVRSAAETQQLKAWRERCAGVWLSSCTTTFPTTLQHRRCRCVHCALSCACFERLWSATFPGTLLFVVLFPQVAGCDVMYLTEMDDNPQQDLQCIQRIWRQGQTEEVVHVYTVMVSCPAELTRLQRQVDKAGSWRQPEYNSLSGGDAPKVLDIPACKDEMPHVDGEKHSRSTAE